MSDILTRLLLNTGDYDAKLSKAKKSSNDFASNISGKAVTAVGKFASGIGVAMGAAEAFGRVIKSSQTTGDKYAETIEGLKASVDAFFTSISTGDFTSFITGMDAVVSKAREAYAAMDQLGNAQMSFGIAQVLNQRDIAEAQQLAKNKFAPLDVRKGAFADWRTAIGTQQAQSAQLEADIQRYVTKAVESKAGIKGFTANMDNVMKGLLLDIQDEGKRSELKKKYEAEYKEYTAAVSEASKLLRTGSKTEAEKMHDSQQYHATLAKLNEQYNEAITINSLLVRYGDDDLKAIGDHVKSMIQLDGAVANLKREYNETANEFNNANKGVKGFTPLEAFEGYTVYSGTSEAAKNFTPKVSGTTGKMVTPVVMGYSQYGTDLGQKVLEWMNGKEIPIIKVPIEIDEQIDEEDLSNLWPKHIKKIEDMNSALSSTGEIFGSIGSIMGSFGENMGAWLMGTVGNIAQMIVQLQSLATANGVLSASKLPFPANLVAVATVVGTIASVFASLPKFAEGGVVGGSSFFGDKLLARVNSGEMILNQRQQARALSLMDNGGNVRVSGDVRLSGKDIYISLRNYMASSGNRL
jgi:hypothetical protein